MSDTPVFDKAALTYKRKKRKREMVRVYGGRYKSSFTMFVSADTARFVSHGIEYVRTRQRDGIDLPIFVRAESQVRP